MALAVASSAHAQAGPCKGKVFIDSVYQVGLGGNSYEYYIQLRNATDKKASAKIEFHTFGSSVSLFTSSMIVPTGPHASQKIKFGKGTNGNINAGTVKVLYDSPGMSQPSITVNACLLQ